MIEDKKKLTLYYAVNAFSWCTLGLYTVSLSWLVLKISESASSVGLFYLFASASSLLISPFLGPLLGRANASYSLIFITAIVRCVALITPLLLTTMNVSNANLNILIFLVAILFGPSNSVFGAASEGVMLSSWPPTTRSEIAKRAGLVRQISLASGFAMAGFFVDKFSSQVTSAIAGILGLIGALICLLFFYEKEKLVLKSNINSFLFRLTEGFNIIILAPMLILPAVVATLGFSVSQMSNALLAPIISSQHKTSNEFGFIKSSWAIDAITTALLINVFPLKKYKNECSFLILTLLGILSIIFSQIENSIAQILVFASMGCIFSYLRIISGAEIALHTPSESIAKVQLTLSNLISLTALFVYTIPWMLRSLSSSMIFSIWGFTIIIIGTGIFLTLRYSCKEIFSKKVSSTE